MKALALALLLAGCDKPTALLGADAGKPSAPERPGCKKAGDQCEFSPGKLGTCVSKEPCSGYAVDCLVCQSQH